MSFQDATKLVESSAVTELVESRGTTRYIDVPAAAFTLTFDSTAVTFDSLLAFTFDEA